MILSHLAYLLRVTELTCAIVLLGMSGHLTFKYLRNGYRISPRIFLGVNAAFAALSSYGWLLQPTSVNSSFDFSIYLGVLSDFINSICWLLVGFIYKIDCGGVFYWSGLTNGSYCSWWEAISFISACLWLASATLGCIYSLRLVA